MIINELIVLLTLVFFIVCSNACSNLGFEISTFGNIPAISRLIVVFPVAVAPVIKINCLHFTYITYET